MHAAQTGNIDSLRQVQQHGGEIGKYQNEADAMNSLMHYAVKANQKETVEFLAFM
jgi:hypothetical protein